MYAIVNTLLSYILVTVRVTGSRELCNAPKELRYCNINKVTQWFTRFAPRIPRDPRPVPRGPWIDFSNSYFE